MPTFDQTLNISQQRFTVPVLALSPPQSAALPAYTLSPRGAPDPACAYFSGLAAILRGLSLPSDPPMPSSPI